MIWICVSCSLVPFLYFMLYLFLIFKYAVVDHDQANKSIWKFIVLNEKKILNFLSGTNRFQKQCVWKKSLFFKMYLNNFIKGNEMLIKLETLKEFLIDNFTQSFVNCVKFSLHQNSYDVNLIMLYIDQHTFDQCEPLIFCLKKVYNIWWLLYLSMLHSVSCICWCKA